MTTQVPDHDLTQLFGSQVFGSPPTDDDMAALRARLADEAATAGLLDIAYRTLDSPVGTLLWPPPQPG